MAAPDDPAPPPALAPHQTRPGSAVLGWAARQLGCPAVTILRGLRDGGSPWLLQAGGRRVVLCTRTEHRDPARMVATEAAGLAMASRSGVPVPELLGHDDGTASGTAAVLSAFLPGDSAIPREPDPARLRTLGAAAARLHAVPCAPSDALPWRRYPVGDVDFAALRAGHDVGPLQRAAQAELDRAEAGRAGSPGAPDVLVHGDLWQGNTLWSGGTLLGVVDWDCAGAGAPGVDLGSLRMDAALCYGADSADEVTAGWAAEAGRPAADIPYWDITAALASPPGLGWFISGIIGQGRRPDLTAELLRRRHADFLGRALDQFR